MKKTHITTSLLLSASLLLGGCSQITSNPASTADTSSTSVSLPESSNYTESSSPESSAQNTSEDAEPVPVEFTDEDKELQKILSDMYDPTWNIVSLFWGFGVTTELYPDAADWRLIIPEISFYGSFYFIPDNFRRSFSMVDVPTSKAEMEKLFSKYFSKEMIDTLLARIPVCELIEQSGKSLTLKLKDNPEIYKKEYARINFIEVDGRLYSLDGRGAYGYIEVDTAKVTKKTDDTIEFSFLDTNGFWLYKKEQFLNNTSLYSEWAGEGMLKLEDGVWKMHSWDDVHFPLLT